jgi:hypothetical protein
MLVELVPRLSTEANRSTSGSPAEVGILHAFDLLSTPHASANAASIPRTPFEAAHRGAWT